MKKLSAVSTQLSAKSDRLSFKEYTLKDFKNLKVWEKAHSITLSIYKITRNFPKDELYGLTSQMGRVCSAKVAPK